MDMTFAHVRRVMTRYSHDTHEKPERIRASASVAMILSGHDDDLQLCFIRRTTREGDAWSGHMAFPGGRAQPEDESTEAVAIRETHEEVGLVLDEQHLVGALDEIQLFGRGQQQPGVLSPFVFLLPGEPPSLTPDPREVAEAAWISVRELCAPESFAPYEFTHPETREQMAFPGIAYQEHIIWGLTYRVFAQFAELAGWPLPGL